MKNARNLVLAVAAVAAMPLLAKDVLTVGSMTAKKNTTVEVPVYLRDVSGTPLGTDKGAGSKIQGVAFRVRISPASAVNSVSFSRRGVFSGKTPLYELNATPPGSISSVGYVSSFAEATNLIAFVSNKAAPGDQIGVLVVALGNTDATQVTIAIDSDTATVSNQGGATVETVANGKLSLVNGLITLVDSYTRGDLSGDGKADILWRNASTTRLWTMNGIVITASTDASEYESTATVLGIDDFNGDGRADILWRRSTGEVVLWTMSGATRLNTFSVATAPANWVLQGVGDFNGDRKADMLWRDNDTNEARVWTMNGSTIVAVGTVASPPNIWSVQGVGDFNGDTKADILWRNSTNNEVWAWLMNGTTIASTGYVATPNSAWQIRGVGDFSGDGKADVVWRNLDTNQVVAWTMNGTAIAAAGYLATPNSSWELRAVGDFDGDLKADVMWRNGSTGENAVWLLNGTALKSSAYVTRVQDLNWTVVGPR
ncbi:MAG TPA: VCBS repeat-containing protein [Thermoanaerobaculia bacterium]